MEKAQMTDAEIRSQKRRCNVYIDGYNWYHAIFKHYPEWKWLNIQKFFEALRPRQDIAQVKMFSALNNPASCLWNNSDSGYSQQRTRASSPAPSRLRMIFARPNGL